MMKILLTGAISLSNKGTAAIAISTIQNLNKILNYPDISIELFYPEKQKKIIDLEKEYGVHVVAPPMQHPLNAILLFILVILGKILRIKKLHIRKLDHYENADIIVDISAEAFVKFYDEKISQTSIRFLLHLYPILTGIFLEKKIVLLGQTLAPFGYFRPIMKYVIRKATLITLRDPTSIKNLNEEKIDVSKMYICADPAFLLDPAPKSRIQSIMRAEGIDLESLKDKRIIGLSLGKILKSKKHQEFVELFAEVIDILIREYDAVVLFVPHSSGIIRQQSDDRIIGMALKKYVSSKYNFFTLGGDYSPQELKGIIGEMDYFISLRMHPVIAAITMGVPSTIIAFNDKAYGLMEMCGLNNCVIDVRDANKDILIASIKETIEKSNEIKKTLENKIPMIKEKSLLNFNLLDTILHEK